jgi:glycosyltransferase involved in cell wall biosynthesis
MRILMFSMTPLFADKSMGGAQKQLKKVALHLAEQGHQVTILCTRRSDAREPFQWHDNLRVIPIFRFKQPFPEPYDTAPYNVAAAIQDTSDYLAQSDIFYNHDGGLIFPYLHQQIPSVVSLRSVRFSETIQSGFLFQGDALILPSQHTADVWRHTVGRFFPALDARIHVIQNGLDWEAYRYTLPDKLLAKIPVNPAEHAIVLYPHRPEENKGIHQTIAIADLLVHKHKIHNLRVLVPKWIDTGLSPEVKAFYDALEQTIAARGLGEHFVFHDWIGDDDMPAFYSLGAVTLAVGNYVETFGNTPYESLACGTPVIAARVAAYRGMLPDECLIDYGKVDEAAARAARIITEKQRVDKTMLHWLHTHFAQSDMVEAYARVILNARKLPPMSFMPQPITEATRFKLAPWCYISRYGVYHDFRGDYTSDPDLVDPVLDYPAGFTMQDTDAEEVMRLYREGYLVGV